MKNDNDYALTRAAGAATITLLGALAAASAGAQSAGAQYDGWSAYQGGAHSSQYSALEQIDTSNVSKLEPAWTFPAGDSNYAFNPIMVDGVLYVLARDNELVALDAATGRELWARPHEQGLGGRGINYWQSSDGADRRLLYLTGGLLTAIDARSGETITEFGNDGYVDFRDALAASGRDVSNVRPLSTGNPGRVFEDLVIVALPARNTPGDVQAYDVRTGELRWVFHSIPRAGEHGYDTWPEGTAETARGVHNWSEFTVDAENGIVFVPFGSPRFDFYGGDREGANLYGNSLVAIDARTGERIWHQQLVHHDLWDYDLPQAPKLLTIRPDGEPVDVVAQATKHGFVFVFERLTGEPIWPIEERPVPASDVPGEHAWPTQPFPTKPPPFAVQQFTADDINPYLPEEEQETLRARLAIARNEGLFTPPSIQGSILMPGHNGGANWGGGAVDPLRGEIYVVSKNVPVMQTLILRGAAGSGGPGGRGNATVLTPEQVAETTALAQRMLEEQGSLEFSSPYDFLMSPSTGLAAIAPPWAQLTAYDLNTGEIRWQVPHGTVTARPELGIEPDSGAHFPRSGPLVTAGGLLFLTSASDRTLRAYDRASGDVLWSTALPSGSEGTPATYAIGGRQYLVVPATAGNGMMAARVRPEQGEAAGGAYIAFALPGAAEREGYRAPRTSWGDPDLQGKWPGTHMVGVPMQRPERFGTRNVLTDEEFAERQSSFEAQEERDLADFSHETADETPGGTVGGPVSPPPHWLERGEPQRQASLIVDPPNGRMPPLTEAAQQRIAALRAARASRGPADSYTDRSLYDRCITRGVAGSILPVIYNNGNEIVQAPGYVAIRNEMIHETRVIPLDGRPHVNSSIRMWMGDSRGRWEGDTLVVETTNLTDRTAIGLNGGGTRHSERMTIVERLTRVDDDTLAYEMTIDDPETWTRPWTMSFPLERDDNYGFYEYACHEGNYAMSNILRGARAEERAAAERDASGQ